MMFVTKRGRAEKRSAHPVLIEVQKSSATLKWQRVSPGAGLLNRDMVAFLTTYSAAADRPRDQVFSGASADNRYGRNVMSSSWA